MDGPRRRTNSARAVTTRPSNDVDELDQCSHGYTAGEFCSVCDDVIDLRADMGPPFDAHAFRVEWARGHVQCICGRYFDSRADLDRHVEENELDGLSTSERTPV